MTRLIFGGRPGQHPGVPLRFREQEQARRFLQTARSDDSVMRHLRRWVAESGYAARDDRETLDRAATALLTGKLRVWRVPVAGTGRYVADSGAEETRPATPGDVVSTSLFEPAASRLPLPPAGPEPRHPTGSAFDVAQQVRALLAAARNGAPFCEQCERNR